MVVKCFSLDEAKKILTEKGIVFERMIADDKLRDRVHIYFMVGTTEVAYYIPLIHSLFIQYSPREWYPDMLVKTHTLGQCYKES